MLGTWSVRWGLEPQGGGRAGFWVTWELGQKPGQTPPAGQVSQQLLLHLLGKHPPESGDDGLRRPHCGHHRGKGPTDGVQGERGLTS